MPVITPRPKVRLRVKPALLPLEIELQAGDDAIQWRYVGTETWNDLVEYADLDASVTIGTVTTLAAGSSATVTNVGTAQDVVLDIGIPRGQDGVMASIVAGTNIDVDATDPANPIVSAISSAAVDSVNGATGVVVLDAGDIAVTPAGSIAATDVQAALQELDTEKQPLDADLTALATAFSRATASGPAYLDLAEDTDNGTNRIRVTAPASVGSDVDLTLPVATDTLIGKATTDTLTNKTFNANGTGNSLSNVEIADFAASAIVTAAEGLASSDNDTSVPTTAAVIDHVAANSGGMTLLGTLATTSGSTQSLTGISAGYRQFYVEFDEVSFNAAAQLTLALSSTNGAAYGAAGTITETTGGGGGVVNGFAIVGNVSSTIAAAKSTLTAAFTGGVANSEIAVGTPTNTAARADAIRFGGGTFDGGTIRIYGVH